jgi:hypothetical protein
VEEVIALPSKTLNDVSSIIDIPTDTVFDCDKCSHTIISNYRLLIFRVRRNRRNLVNFQLLRKWSPNHLRCHVHHRYKSIREGYSLLIPTEAKATSAEATLPKVNVPNNRSTEDFNAESESSPSSTSESDKEKER